MDPVLQELLDVFAQGSTQALPEPNIIGGFYGGPTAETGSIWPEWAQDAGAGRPTTLQGGNPAYYEGADIEVLSAMNTEELSRFQDTLVAYGIVREVVPGRLDDATINGMSTLMSLGNRQGVRWQSVLDGVVRGGGLSGGKTAEQFEARTYLKPDYATLAQDVKDTFRKRLGREPDEYEMQQLTGELTGYYSLANEAQTELDRMQFEQQATPGVQAGGTVQAVDPMARFQQLFDEKYKGEMAFNVDKEDAQISRAVVESGTNTLDQMIDRSR